MKMNRSIELDKQVIMVTGAASGIGRAVSIELAKAGARLILIDLNQEGLDATFSMLPLETDCFRIQENLAELEDADSLFSKCVSKMGKISGIVHCAGIAPIIPLSALTRDKIRTCMQINFYSFLELVRCFGKKKYHNDKGCIVAISSINSLSPEKCQTVYSASKAAINTSIQTLAQELWSNGIRINAVLPGIVNTEMAKRAFDEMGEENAKAKMSKQLLGITEPKQIADIVLFLLSDLSTAITGRIIYADGGFLSV